MALQLTKGFIYSAADPSANPAARKDILGKF
jgi:hypothetical protein